MFIPSLFGYAPSFVTRCRGSNSVSTRSSFEDRKFFWKFGLALRFQSLRHFKILLFEYGKPSDFRKLQDRHVGGVRSLEVSILTSVYESPALRERDGKNARVIMRWLEHSFNR